VVPVQPVLPGLVGTICAIWVRLEGAECGNACAIWIRWYCQYQLAETVLPDLVGRVSPQLRFFGGEFCLCFLFECVPPVLSVWKGSVLC
jgi:hypothetical protein